MVYGVEHQLELAPLGADDHVVTLGPLGERRSSRRKPPARSPPAPRRGPSKVPSGSKPTPVAECCPRQSSKTHVPATAWLNCSSCSTRSNCSATCVRMRDQQQRNLLFAARLAHQVNDLLLMPRIDVGRRLVGQQQFGPIRQCAGDGDALLLADCDSRSAYASADGQPHALEQWPRPGRHRLVRRRSSSPAARFRRAENRRAD